MFIFNIVAIVLLLISYKKVLVVASDAETTSIINKLVSYGSGKQLRKTTHHLEPLYLG